MILTKESKKLNKKTTNNKTKIEKQNNAKIK